MDPRLIEYNRQPKHQMVRRRLHIWGQITFADLMRGGQARLARQLGVHRSTICRDMKAWWAWVREREHDQHR